MTHDPTEFVITDPRTFEGDPYEVAERAAAQVEALLSLTIGAIAPAELMARNAWMQRRIDTSEAPEGTEWPESPEGKRWARLKAALAAERPGAKGLKLAAGFNPKRPPKVGR